MGGEASPPTPLTAKLQGRNLHLIAPCSNFSNMSQNFIFDVTNDFTDRDKCKTLDFLTLLEILTRLQMTSDVNANFAGLFSGKAGISSWNKADWTAWIVSGIPPKTFVEVVSNEGHLRSPGQKRLNLKILSFGGGIHVLGQIFVKNAKNDPRTNFEQPKLDKNWKPEKCQNSRT